MIGNWCADDRLDLAGRVVVVADGSHGVALAVAAALCDRGAHVVVTCPPNDVDADRARLVLTGRPGPATLVELPPHDADAWRELLEGVHERHDRLDACVHRAHPRLREAAEGQAKVAGGRLVLLTRPDSDDDPVDALADLDLLLDPVPVPAHDPDDARAAHDLVAEAVALRCAG
ncbi:MULTISPECIES: hypothetical protein [Actinosynnema]|uniref:hypothetical protein n=1 Tax=Actinosynnema TaxID=40566 RepID=UPI0020A2E5D5|nr:hypothetical protein [Actinosynnema pretiosum]MCP2094431.1 short chain dehydrogenase [Actinosynnema pretiosum]